MPKKFTKAADGWIQVHEDDEQSIDDLVKEIDMLIADHPATTIQETKKFQSIDETVLNDTHYRYPNAVKIHDNVGVEAKRKMRQQTNKKPAKTKKRKERKVITDWEKQATKDALWCLLFTFGSIGLIFGVLAIFVATGSLTWEGIGEAVVVFMLKAIWWAYETFFNLCVTCFEWILQQVNNIA